QTNQLPSSCPQTDRINPALFPFRQQTPPLDRLLFQEHPAFFVDARRQGDGGGRCSYESRAVAHPEGLIGQRSSRSVQIERSLRQNGLCSVQSRPPSSSDCNGESHWIDIVKQRLFNSHKRHISIILNRVFSACGKVPKPVAFEIPIQETESNNKAKKRPPQIL
ncbi:unnamed protein product, partial [Larinioides sclopetarius]